MPSGACAACREALVSNYKAFCPGKHPIEIMGAKSSYDAQQRAAAVWDLKPSQRHQVTVMLCEKDGKQVTHVATE
jgi:hypothetical protein